MMINQVVRIVVSVGCTLAGASLLVGSPGCGSGRESDGIAASESVEQGITELNCNFTAPDFNCGSQNCDESSLDASYDHPSCSHAWIGQKTFATAGGPIVAFYDWQLAPIPNGHSYPCSSTWVRAIILSYSSGLWTLYSDTTHYGYEIPADRCATAVISVNVPRGTYKVLTQAGFITAFEPVHLTLGGVGQIR